MDSKRTESPRLVLVEGTEVGRVVPLVEGKTTVGRTKGDVVLGDPRMSRAHVELHFDPSSNTLRFVDLQSMNGTLVNGEAKAEGTLVHGDRLQLGNTVLLCELGATSDKSLVAILSAESSQVRAFDESSQARIEPSSEAVARASSSLSIVPPGGGKFHKEARAAAAVEPAEGLESRPPPEGYALPEQPVVPVAVVSAPVPREEVVVREKKPSIFAGLQAHLRERMEKAQRFGNAFVRRARFYAGAAILLIVALFGMQKYSQLRGGDPASLMKRVREIEKVALAGKGEEALKAAEAFQKEFPNRPESWLALGSVQLVLGRPEPALFSFEKAKQLPPPLAIVRAKLFRLYARAQRIPEAEQELLEVEASIKNGQANRDILEETAYAILENKELKQPPEKVFILAKALEEQFAPDSTVGYRLEAQALIDARRPKQAVEAVSRGLKLNPADEELLEVGVFAKLGAQDLPGALLFADSWAQKFPQSTKARLVTAHIHFNQGDALAAVPHLQKILEICGDTNEGRDPFFGEALDLLGVIHQRANQLAEAGKLFTRACNAGFSQSCDRARQPAQNATAPSAEAPAEEAPPLTDGNAESAPAP